MLIEASSNNNKEDVVIKKNENWDRKLTGSNAEERDSFEEGYFSLYECDKAILSN